MIYFDNSATTWPKPDRVYRGVYEYMKKYAANPGRSGHTMARASSDIIYSCREITADFIGVSDPAKIIFTKNTTEALNIVIKGVLCAGDHAVCTSMEHNSVLRPLDKLSKNGVKFDIVWGDSSGYVSPQDIENAIRPNTKLVIVNHVSNVCGTIQDIAKIGKIAHKHGALYAVDGAQSGGVLDFDMTDIDFLCLAGHKGLYGPMGTGVLCINCDCPLDTLFEGGTGSYSSHLSQPDELPDRFESGTLNAVGLAGLMEGIKFLRVVGTSSILEHERHLASYFISGLMSIPGVVLYGSDDMSRRTGVVAFNKKDKDCVELAQTLNDRYNIACRAGYHCAYTAHQTIGSGDCGAVRFSFGRFNTKDEVSRALFAIAHA